VLYYLFILQFIHLPAKTDKEPDVYMAP